MAVKDRDSVRNGRRSTSPLSEQAPSELVTGPSGRRLPVSAAEHCLGAAVRQFSYRDSRRAETPSRILFTALPNQS